MLFNSFVFLTLFFPVCLGLFYLFAEHKNKREWCLILLSFVFYGYWDIRLLPLLIGSILFNWLLVKLTKGCLTKSYLVFGVGLNLCLIAFFKYFNFFIENLSWITGAEYKSWSIILPLGISFFTFQQISYLVDCYRKQAPEYGFRE